VNRSSGIALINMPFFQTDTPSLGLSLLKSSLSVDKIPCRVYYLNLWFAEEVGLGLFQKIAHWIGVDLAQEWVFAEALWGPNRRRDESFLKQVVARGAQPRGSDPGGLSVPDYIEKIRFCRDKAESFLKRCLNTIPWEEFRVIGFHSQFQQQIASLALAKQLKSRFPKAVVVFGGANGCSEMGLALMKSFPFLDAVCPGEGDIVFPKFVQRVLAGKPLHSMPGLLHRSGPDGLSGSNAPGVRDLDRLPFPDYDDFIDQRLLRSRLEAEKIYLLLETSRGCWWGEKSHCAFCGQDGNSLFFRQKSAERALEEISWLIKRYGPWTRTVVFTDNVLPRDYPETLFPRLARLKARFQFFYETRVNLTKDELRMYRQAVGRTVQAGLESLSTAVLRRMSKGTTAQDNIQFLKWCLQYGIRLEWNFLFGVPGEQASDYRKVPDLVRSISHLQPPRCVSRVSFHRFSPYQTRSSEFGIRRLRPYPLYKAIYPGLSDKTISSLAYYFVGNGDREKTISKYAEKLLKALDGWREGHVHSALFSVEEKDRLLICDFRPGFPKRIFHLKGQRRRLYKTCDRIRSHSDLLRLASSKRGQETVERSLEADLGFFLKNRLMIEEGKRYLSLAVPLRDDYFPPAALWPHLPKVLAALDKA